MDNVALTLDIDLIDGTILLTLRDAGGAVRASRNVPATGHVDNLLLTSVDKLLTSATLDRSALAAVQIGQGIDKNSSSYRIVQSFATAITAASASRRNPAA